MLQTTISNRLAMQTSLPTIRTSLKATPRESNSKLSSKVTSSPEEPSWPVSSMLKPRKLRITKSKSTNSMPPEQKRTTNSKRKSRSTKKQPLLSLKSEDFSNRKWKDPHSYKRKPAPASQQRLFQWSRSKCRKVWEEHTNSDITRVSLASSRSSPVSPAKLNNSPTEDN